MVIALAIFGIVSLFLLYLSYLRRHSQRSLKVDESSRANAIKLCIIIGSGNFFFFYKFFEKPFIR